MRILIVIPGAGVGGIATGLLGILKSFDPSRHRFIIVASHSGGARKLFRRNRFKYIVLPPRGRVGFLRSLILREKIQLVQSCDSATEGALAARQLNLPHIWYVGGNIEQAFKGPNQRSLRSFKVMMSSLSDKIVVQSRALARDVFPNLLKRQIQVIPWGVEPGTGPCKVFRKAYPSIGMVANFYPAKRHMDFLSAASMIYRKVPRARFLIAGHTLRHPESVRYKQKILRAIQKRKLNQIVRMTKFAPDQSSKWYQRLNLLIIPSYEGMSQAMLEAGIHSVPVVAANIGGVRDVIRNQKSGLLTPYQNSHKMAEAAVTILMRPQLARRLAKNNRTYILKSLTASSQAKKFDRLYHHELQKQAQQDLNEKR